jgi:lipopolysaccharide/colanic/teichoic acid biosynthesis glycosyltransferase
VSPQIINEELFKGVLHRERRRSDRTNQGLMLLVVSADAARRSTTTWKAIIDALAAAKRETDPLGWFEQETSIGVILPDIEAEGESLARVLDARFRVELSRALEPEALAGLTVGVHRYPEPKRAEHEPAPAADVLPATFAPSEKKSPAGDAIKRVIDVVGSSALLLLLSPILLVVAALIKLKSPGPIFFKQERVGRMMKPFKMIKFRTMRVDADHALHHAYVSNFIKSNAAAQAEGAAGPAVYKITSDPRVTAIGRILRKTSIDELPQLWNVLRGDMSLVGPRPPLQYEVEQYQRWHCRRVLESTPGLTGLWQVAGRSRTTFDEMVRLDLRYARTRSVWTDVKILLATPAAVIDGKGAC